MRLRYDTIFCQRIARLDDERTVSRNGDAVVGMHPALLTPAFTRARIGSD